ncbi:hypothetical protein GCM10028801_43560 [Nocardioides maradonensis]
MSARHAAAIRMRRDLLSLRGLGQRRPAVFAACEGFPVLLSEAETDLVALINTVNDYDYLLDPVAERDETAPAVYVTEHLLNHYGLNMHAGGKRITGVEYVWRRYLVPFLVELAWSKPAEARGTAALRITDTERLPRILAGTQSLPAATVAGDILDRRAVSCLHLSLEDAAAATAGGTDALERAIADERIRTHADLRTGASLIRPYDLRAAGLLVEPADPHGVSAGTARNVLRELNAGLERARMHGAGLIGCFLMQPLEPLPANRQRPRSVRRTYVSIATIARLMPYLPVTAQVTLWIERLLGVRISEGFGPLVSDYVRDANGRGWLAIDKQGGLSMLQRAPDGLLEKVEHVDGTKTDAGERVIPLPLQLADLIEQLIAVFHTDPDTGRVRTDARLIPGIGKDDASGQSTYRNYLKEACARADVQFTPHTLRGSLITDLKEAQIEERIRFAYAGHGSGTDIQSRHYDLGVSKAKLIEAADVLAKLSNAELGESASLRAATGVREQWGRGTRNHTNRDVIEQRLIAASWRVRDHDPIKGSALSVEEVAARMGRAATTTRRMMAAGEIPAFQRPWHTRLVWAAWESDVQRWLDSQGTELRDIAADVGWSYHEIWTLAVKLGLGKLDRLPGQRWRLNDEDVATLLAAVDARESIEARSMTVSEASERLGIGVDDVTTLIDHGYVNVVEAAPEHRFRRVTASSVEAFGHDRDTRRAGRRGHDDRVTVRQAALLLRCDQRTVPRLARAGVLDVVQRSSRQYVTLTSLLAHAENTDVSVAERIRVDFSAGGRCTMPPAA